MVDWVDQGIHWFCMWFPENSFWYQEFNIRALLALILISLVCGSVGALVVGNRMSFFSDALAHCAFAGVALGLMLALAQGVTDQEFRTTITLIMVGFGVLVGILITFVREKTGLSGDTVIGVFFAGAVGLGGIFTKASSGRKYFNLESFIFGDPTSASAQDLLTLLPLLLLTLVFLFFMYNNVVFASFNASLGRSRQVPVRLCNYLFVILLGIIINLCLQIVGTLLINGLLIVPAAAAANLCRNMRQLFWTSIGLCVAAGFLGQALSWEIAIPDPVSRKPITFGIGGMVVVIAVLFFVLSMWLGSYLKNRHRAESTPSTAA